MIEYINTTVDSIIDEMLQLETNLQIVFKMLQHCSAQQLTYLLRTCPPPTTLHAARRLDAAIANTIHRIMDCVPLLPPEDSIAMRAVLNRLFLSVRLGGDGFINSEATCEAVYAASMLYCGPLMRSAVPTLGTSDIVAPPPRCYPISARTGRSMHTNSGFYPSLDTTPATRPTEAHPR